jgi:lysophospholipase L1-like esterase
MAINIIPHRRAIVYLALLTGAAATLFYQFRISGPDSPRPSIEDSRPEWYLSAETNVDAFGDSITYGESFSFDVDKNGYPRKVEQAFQGWPELLGQMLTRKTGSVTAVWNMGYPGDRANESVSNRLPGLLKLKTGSDSALLLMGTNDSNDFNPTVSGKGCSGDACGETYKGEVLSVIQALQAAGRKSIYLGTITPAWGPDVDTRYADPLDPLTATRNQRIQEYNQIITGELAGLPGVKPGPDLFSCFLSPTVNRFSLFKDSLHPNTLGYTFMAALWLEAITETHVKSKVEHCASPIYILASLDPYAHGHKQNLLDEGDEYYVDESFTLTSIPAELHNGIWVTPANADNRNADPEYLHFDVGLIPVSVYIAFDPAGKPPVSSTQEFDALTRASDLLVSDESLARFSFVHAAGVTGSVRIGGNRSRNSSVRQQAYLVIVVPG